MNDELMELPENWLWASAEECTKRITDGEHVTPERSETGILLLSARNVQNGWLSLDKVDYIPEHIYEVLARRLSVEPGDVLLSCSGTVGRSCVAPKNLKFALVRSVAVLKPFEEMGEFISYALRSPQVQQQIHAKKTQTAQANIFQGSIKKLIFPIPPLNEQKRIVAKIEELRDRHQRAKQALEAIPELCDRFRQSVLAAAFRGDLTADWREENLDVKPASVLLERLREKRLTTAKTDRQKESIEEIYSYKEEYGSELLPDSWQYSSLEKLCYSFQYGTSSKSSSEGKVPVLRMGNLQNREIDWDDLVYTSDEDEITKYLLQPGDVLFNRTNSPELVGKTSIYRGERRAIFAGYLIKIGNYAELNSEYLNYCLNTNYARNYCWRVKTDGVSQSNINAQKLAKFEIPFCSLQEQQEIVRRISSLFQAIVQVEQQYLDSKNLLDRLNQSILAKAFRGELVEQDPNDEPASVLLERIRAEREKADNGKKTKGKRAKQLKLEV